MNPTNQVQQPIQRFTPANDAVYNTLRDTLQRHIAGGVPGLDKVVDSLNKQHVSIKIRQQNAPALPNGYNAYS